MTESESWKIWNEFSIEEQDALRLAMLHELSRLMIEVDAWMPSRIVEANLSGSGSGTRSGEVSFDVPVFLDNVSVRKPELLRARPQPLSTVGRKVMARELAEIVLTFLDSKYSHEETVEVSVPDAIEGLKRIVE